MENRVLPVQEPVNRNWGRVGSETWRGECVRREVWQGPLPALRDPQRGVGGRPGVQGWPGAERHPQASEAPRLGAVNGLKHSDVGIKHTHEIPKPELS